MPPVDNNRLINQTIVQILLEKNNPDEVERLMQADLDYIRERLQIMREHASLDPTEIENRKNSQFKRNLYRFLMLLVIPFAVVAIYAPLGVGMTFAFVDVIIIASIALNGRMRDNDLIFFLQLIEKISMKKP